MTKANETRFGRMDRAGAGNGGTIDILRGDERVGWIEMVHDDANSGSSIRANRYVVRSYEVCFYVEGKDRVFDVRRGASALDVRAVLSAAKAYAREVIAALPVGA